MEILIANPPNYEALAIAFKFSGEEVFAYAPNIYNPNDKLLEPPVIKHEEIHLRQQGDNPEDWWLRYLVDADFRLSQEIEAYQIQYREYKKIYKDRNKLAFIANKLAADLSGPVYNNVINYQEALEAIKSDKLIRFKI